MLRDTLEMIPVAIIMALILSFGVRTGRIPTVPRTPATIAQTGGRGQSFATSRASSTDYSSEAGDAANAVQTSAATSGTSRSPRLFLEKSPQRSDVPFYTSRDIEAMNRTPGHGGPSSSPPRTSESPRRAEPSTAPTAASHLVPINRAGLRELLQIPGVGPVKAQAILAQRPAEGYKEWSEIDRVPGFGAGMITTMKLHATLE